MSVLVSVLDPGAARAFAAEWLEAWNAHDIDRILAHYTDDVELSSPFVVSIAGEASGTLKGKDALRAYWTKALDLLPTLHFELVDVLSGVNFLTIYYRGHRGNVAETMHLDPSRKVRFATSCYGLERLPEVASGSTPVRGPRGQPLRLTGRSSSHFTRVAAIFAHELGLPFDLEVVHDLTSVDAATFGGNPALKVPTLHVGGSALFGTENICRKLAELAGRADDPRVVLADHVTDDLLRSAQELVWHAMAAQVQLRVGIALAELPAENLFFAKARAGMTGALAFVEERLDRLLGLLPAPRDVSLFEVTLFCLVEHVAFRPTVPLEAFPRLRGFAAAFGERASARRTTFRFDPLPAPTT
jgi:glutathione S-transferase